MWRWAILLQALIAALLAATAAKARPQNTDSQLWAELDLDVPLTPSLSLSGLVVLRGSDSLPNPTIAGGGGALSYALSPHWSLSAGDYWLRARSASNGRGVGLQLPLAALTFVAQAGGFAVSDRNRAERIIGLAGEDWRYRNRLTISHPLSLGPVRSVFVSDEVFYDAARASFSRNRAQIGVGLASVGPTALQLYYLRQDDRFSHPGHLNVLGVALSLKLEPRT